jgi:EAL domain-containing protein (putative c-di-GMP-specific phosphodiesterase class I)
VLDDLDAAATGLGIQAAYQPIVSLPAGAVVGFEALTRWPNATNLNPRSVFDHASMTDRLDTLDRLCIESAIHGALGGELLRGTMLLVNSEPQSSYIGPTDSAAIARGCDELSLVYELTEHGLLAHPHALLQKVAAARADGFAIALDDVGAHPDSLALIDIVGPDIVKLDISLIQTRPRSEEARTLAAVLAHHERTGAVILAEGIETDDHLEQALALGATLGQGFRYGEAGPIDRHAAAVSPLQAIRVGQPSSAALSPFGLVSETSKLRTAGKSTLTAFARHIETQALLGADPPMVLMALQKAEYFTERTRRQYCALAERSPLVAVFGQDLPEDLGPRIRGVGLDPSDPLCAEWAVVVLGPHSAAAMLGRERADNVGVPDGDRRFDFVITYDRALVTTAARNLLDRML